MLRPDNLYQWGVVVEHNWQPSPGAGSCIFLHVWRGPGQGTTGCTAIPKDKIERIVRWLDRRRKPLLVQLPAQTYTRMKYQWKLPTVDYNQVPGILPQMNNPAPTTTEQTLWRGTVSHLHYLGKWLLVVVFAAALCGSFLLRFPDSTDVLWGCRVVLLSLMIILVLWIQLDRSRRKYAVTNRRVSAEFGIVNKSSNEVRVQDVRSINLKKSGITGLLGIGTVEFSSAATDDADVIFWNTPEAEKVRDLVRSLQS